MAQIYSINQLRDLVSPVAKQFGVKRVYVFGSYGRKEATAKSDLDLRIDAGNIRSLFELADFRLTLEERLDMPVDVVTSDIDDRRFLKTISPDEVLLYAEQLKTKELSSKTYRRQRMNSEGDNVIFETILKEQEQRILLRLQQVYHLPLERAEQEFRNSAFYRLLMNPDTNLWRKDAEENFRRLQNEIEYGAWNRNELGEIAE